ncbi:hypothetical protein N9Y42_08805 [Mariniblastus sp.]|nr:hypothetical protein [Mariniblastus sp.]
MIRTLLLFCLVVLTSTPDLALARQSPEKATKSSIRDFDSADDMIDWLSEPERNANVLTKDSDGGILSIALSNSTATNGNIELLSQFRSLRHLRIKCANRISPEGFLKFSELKTLEHLELGLVYGKLPVNFWETLALCPKLKKIDLVYLELPDKEMAGVEKLPALESISFRNVKGMTQVSCEQMAALSRLRMLKVSRTTLRPSDIAPLDKMHNNCNISVEFKRNAR